jgi:hypothetical protein
MARARILKVHTDGLLDVVLDDGSVRKGIRPPGAAPERSTNGSTKAPAAQTGEDRVRAKAEEAYLSVYADEMKAATADREASDARRVAAEAERDATVARMKALADADAEAGAARRKEREEEAAFRNSMLARVAAMETAAAQDRAAAAAATQAAMAEQARALTDMVSKALGQVDAVRRAVEASNVKLAGDLTAGLDRIRADLSGIAAMPVELTAWDEKDGKTRATMQRRPSS